MMLISKFGTAKREDILAVSPAVPEELISFLEKYNGGETPETSFSIGGESSDIVAFYGVGDVKYSYANVKPIKCPGQTFLPIAFDSFGNQIVISLENGQIGFMDHEKGEIPTIIARSFSDFLKSVTSKPIDSKHLKPIEEREKELIARGKSANISDTLRTLWQDEIDRYSGFRQEEVVI